MVLPITVAEEAFRIEVFYSDKYFDDVYEYRHCELKHEGLQYAITNYSPRDSNLPEQFLPLVYTKEEKVLLNEHEWRAMGKNLEVGTFFASRIIVTPRIFCLNCCLKSDGGKKGLFYPLLVVRENHKIKY